MQEEIEPTAEHAWAWKIVLAVGILAVGGYFLLPGAGGKDIGYSVIGLGSTACVIAGILRWRPYAREGWIAVAAGNFCFVLGDGVYDLYQFVLHRPTPFPSLADAFYLAGYPFLIVGVVRLTRRRVASMRSKETYADATIVAVGALALSWHYLMGPYAHELGVGTFGKFVNLAYPVLDLAVLFIVAHGLVFGAARLPVHRLLALAMTSMIVADFVYDLMSRLGTYTTGDAVDAGWLLNYVIVGAAALHPSVVRGPRVEPSRELADGGRLPAVALAGIVAPVILFVDATGGSSDDVGVLAILSLVLFVLVVLRMRMMFRRMTVQRASLEEIFGIRDSLEDELRHRAFHDGLTGLANRALLHDRVEHALDAASRSHALVALCFCDLDGFKTINDSLGHLTGDALLVAASKRLAAIVRVGDTVARLGGDEFAILMEDVEDPKTAVAMAMRIVEVLRQPIDAEGRHVSISASVGVTIGDRHSTPVTLLSQADSAMYEAKAAGRNRYALFEESMLIRSRERLELTNALNGALDREEFVVQFQPQFSLDDGALEGFETLVRWRHPTLGVLTPEKFIGVAEQTGQIVAIGRWVIEQACEHAASWQRVDPKLSVSVNLSARQLCDPGLVDDVRTALALGHLPPDRLTLEITESVLVANVDQALTRLGELKSLGVRLAIDDFGTGYSSLSYLRDFPIDYLKIDKSFVDPLADPTGEGSAFITTIIALARNLGATTVAEGIELAVQRDRLRELGCDSAQGFLLSRPLSVAAADALAIGQAVPDLVLRNAGSN